ncbi:NAD(P)-dependent oxidoreductase [Nocardioides sp. LHD-245]|uniref:NAD-dependent epimerase/dehydratase family protein n=1 Tax=Nocardioides sp. LHD-245 TaxID=3051387 RepID=UPI0027E19F58|nr:NAD(P)-dependent oxidoreductase [Nocardioides sp. LHD-245]
MTAEIGAHQLDQIAAHVRQPSDALVEALARTDGDIAVIGAAGKMGVSLTRMAAAALDRLPGGRRVVAVSRFSDPDARAELDAAGVRTVVADVADPGSLQALPDAANVVYLVGRKFGTSSDSSATWFTNTVLPSVVLDRYRGARVVALSSGNVYPFSAPVTGGCAEETPYGPVGDYAQSCVGREQVIVHRSVTQQTPTTLVRLNYAVDCRYGVLTDIARAVQAGEAVDLSQGAVNVVWQGDANRYCLSALTLADVPPAILNVTGPETVSVRWLAEELGQRLGRSPVLTGEEAPTALLSNASRCHALFGYPDVPLATMLDWTVAWLTGGGALLDKPTGFGTRDGRF